MADNFKVLDEREHILARPSMYIGSTSLESHYTYIDGAYTELRVVPGLIKVINEIIDNSTDEYIRTNGKFANKIDIVIGTALDPNIVSVSDNGRGIPVEKIDGVWRPELVWTRARTGTNFDDNDRVTIGMNGVGSFITNVFSTSFSAYTSDGKKSYALESGDNALKSKSKTGKDSSKGTSVTFRPDMSRFEVDEITLDHVKWLRNRLLNMVVCFPKLQFTLNGEKIKFTNIKALAKMYGEHALPYDFGTVKMFVANSGASEEFRLVSYVNGLHISGGGSMADYFVNGIVDELRPAIKRKHKIDVLPNQIKQHLLLGLYAIGFKDLKFDSQTKERITNTKKEIDEHISKDVDFKKISKQILDNDDIIGPIIDAILAKKEFAERMALAKSKKKAKRAKIAKHIAATDNNPENRTLFITEGLSAMNNLIAVRDPKKAGGYPLKGKVMNVREMKPYDIVKNTELFELMAVIGLEIGKEATDLNYGRLAIMADSDQDGAAITCLLVNFFSMWPKLFEDKRVFVVKSPKYVARKGKDVKEFYTQEEYQKASLKGYEVDYIKGLGSLPRESYHNMINDPYLIQITMDPEAGNDKLDMAFGSEVTRRKLWLS